MTLLFTQTLGFSWLQCDESTPQDAPLAEEITTVVIRVDCELITSGALTEAFFSSLRAAKDRGATVLFVQVGVTPCALISEEFTLVHESWAPVALNKSQVPRPPVATYASHEEAVEGEVAAAQLQTVGVEQSDQAELPSALRSDQLVMARYRVLCPGPANASFETWFAEDLKQRQLVLIHRLHPHLSITSEHLVVALQRWAQCDSPRVAPPLFTQQSEQLSFIVPVGRSLSQLIQHEQPALLVVLELLEALRYCHSTGLFHSSLHPSAVCINSNNQLMLTGFGARFAPGADLPVVYSAPETLDEEDIAPTASQDVYSAAIVLIYTLLKKSPPISMIRNPNKTVNALNIGESLKEALRAALEWEDRPATVNALIEALVTDPILLPQLFDSALQNKHFSRAEALIQHFEASEGAIRSKKLIDTKMQTLGPAERAELLKPLAQASSDTKMWLEIAALERQENLPSVIGSYKSALQCHNTRDQATTAYSALCEVDEEHFVAWAKQLYALLSEERRGAVAHQIAEHISGDGNNTETLLWIDRAVAHNHADSKLLGLQQQLRLEQGHWQQVLATLSAKEHATIEELEQALTLALRSSDPSTIQTLCTQILKKDDHHLGALKQMALTASPDNLTPHLALALATPNSLPAQFSAAVRLFEQGHLKESFEHLQEVLEVLPSHSQANVMAAHYKLHSGDLSQAVPFLEASLNTNLLYRSAKRANAMAELAHVLRITGEKERAFALYEALIEEDPEHTGAWWGLYLLREIHPNNMVAPIHFGPHEALCRLLQGVIEPESATEALSQTELGSAIMENSEDPFQAVVDDLLLTKSIGPQLFSNLIESFEPWENRIVMVRALFSGACSEEGSLDLTSCLHWSEHYNPIHNHLRRTLVFEPSWPLLAQEVSDSFLKALVSRKTSISRPLEVSEEHQQPLSSEPLTPALRLVSATEAVVRVTKSETLTPEGSPLSSPLRVEVVADNVYLISESEPIITKGRSFQEVRAQDQQQYQLGDCTITFHQDANSMPVISKLLPEEELTVEEEDSSDPPSLNDVHLQLIGELTPKPLDSLDRSGAALIWEDGSEQVAISLERPSVYVVELDDGRLRFFSEHQARALATIRQRGGKHFIEQDLTNATGFGGRLSARELVANEMLVLGSGAFMYQVSQQMPSLTMPSPSITAARPMLMLNDGSLLGQPVVIAGSPFRLGRGRACELQIRTDALLSRVHCQITEVDGSFYIDDCNSSNGTRLNGNPVKSKMLLVDGDVIEMGLISLNFLRTAGISPLHPDLPDDDDEFPEDDCTDVVDLAEVKRLKSLCSDEECKEKVRMANRALRVLFSALDEVEGRGRGRSELQLLIDTQRHQFPDLLSGLEVDEAILPAGWICLKLSDCTSEKRRLVLNRTLLSLIDGATDRVCEMLPESEVDTVLSRMAAIGHRNRLRL